MKTKKRGTSVKSHRKKYTLPTSRTQKGNSEDDRESRKTNEVIPRDKTKYISIEEYERQKQEIMRLRQLTETMQTQTNKVINLAREGKMDAFDDSFKTTVVEFTKRIIYPVCPYVSNSEQLDKCMKILANELELTDSKKAMFQYGYKHTVSSAIASKRNADVQSVRKELKGKLLSH